MRIRTLAIVAGLALLAPLAPTAAYAAGPASMSVSAGLPVLHPAAQGGYQGHQAVRVKSHGNTTGKNVFVLITVPIGLTMVTGPGSGFGFCGFVTDSVGRQVNVCAPDGGLADNQTLNLVIQFTSLAGPTPKTRITGPGSIEARVFDETDPSPANNTAPFRGILVGTGHGVAHDPYTPATQSDLTLTTGPVTWVAQANGTFDGSVPARITSGSDAIHFGLQLKLTSPPAGFQSMTIEPEDMCFTGTFITCLISSPMPQNTERSVTLHLLVSALPAPGATATLEVAAYPNDGLTTLTDVTPADNTVTFALA